MGEWPGRRPFREVTDLDLCQWCEQDVATTTRHVDGKQTRVCQSCALANDGT